MAIKKLPSISRLFNNLIDDKESSSIHCFMAKGEKVKIDLKHLLHLVMSRKWTLVMNLVMRKQTN
jgi:hypothetical protein